MSTSGARNTDRSRPRRQNERGVALILVLVLVVLLSVIVVEFAFEAQVEVSLVANHLDDLGAELAAKSAIAQGMMLLEADLNAELDAGLGLFDSYEDPWGQGVPLSAVQRKDDTPAIFQCTIADEWGKIPLNAPLPADAEQPNETLVEIVRTLFEERGAPEDPTDAILDWIDADDDERSNGAEAQYYGGLETPYACKNAPFDSVEELLLIPGITPEVYFGDPEDEYQVPLSEIFTPFGNPRGKINVNTAAYETLRAYGKVLGVNALEDYFEQVRENGPFISEDELVQAGILPEKQPRRPVAPEEGAGPAAMPRLLAVQSRVFRIRGDGIAGESSVRIEAFLLRSAGFSGRPFHILDWRVIR